jgi:allophanate hydrolase subunit 2
MSLRVREPGLYSLPVDLGRPHTRHLGMPLGGAADRGALALGNALVGNPPGTVAVEVTLAGPTVEALHPAACVVFGAPFESTVNDRPLPAGTTFTPPLLGSCDRFAVRLGAATLSPQSQGEGQSLRVLDGPQRDWFTGDTFFTNEYEVTTASNRMGLRLKGEPLVRRAGELVSEAVAPGAIQVTNDGQPVVLGVDGQTIGGYPKIAHVIRADLDSLGQLRPGSTDRVRFVRVAPEEAEGAAKERSAFLNVWLNRLRVAERQPVLI